MTRVRYTRSVESTDARRAGTVTVQHALGRAAATVIALLSLVAGVTLLPGDLQVPVQGSAKPSVVTANVTPVGFPVEDCATIVAATAAGALGLIGGGYAATVAGPATLFFGTSAAAFHSAMAGVVWTIKDPAHNCTQHVGGAAATKICNASHFSAWDPRGRAARTLVRVATKGEYSRC